MVVSRPQLSVHMPRVWRRGCETTFCFVLFCHPSPVWIGRWKRGLGVTELFSGGGELVWSWLRNNLYGHSSVGLLKG